MNSSVKRGLNSTGQSSKDTGKKFECEICKISVSCDITLRQHLRGHKHRYNVLALEEQKRAASKCGIFIRGYPDTIGQQAILNYFSIYGPINWIHVGNGFMLLDYTNPQAAANVIRREHYLGGRRLFVTYRENRLHRSVKKEDEDIGNVEELKNVRTFDDQVQILTRNLQIDLPTQRPKYDKICKDLYFALSRSFPHCQIFPFGSTITGLSFKNSDIDVFISGIKNSENDAPYLYKTRNILMNSQRFSNTIVIAHAKIPILKCIHDETGISCDINIRNMLGVCNSKLIRYYTNISPKIKTLLIILKYWAKVHKITASTVSMSLSFVATEAIKVFKLPRMLEWGISTARDKQRHFEEYVSVKTTLQFFSFYSSFEYGTYVISPYLGSPMRIEEFKDPANLPACYNIYKRYIEREDNLPLKINSSICIQDPFEHSRNISGVVSQSILAMFVNLCHYGKKLCEENEEGLLYRLITEEPPSVKNEIVTNASLVEFAVPMGVNLKYLEKSVTTELNRKESLQEAWFEKFHSFLKVVLRDFLKFQIEEKNEPTPTKNMKNEDQSDIHDTKDKNQVCYKCSAKLNLWQARKTVNKDTESKEANGVIEKEVAVTDKLCKLYKDVEITDNIIEFDISLKSQLDPPRAIIRMNKTESYKKTFKSFATYFPANFKAWFDLYEKELNLSA